MGEFLDFFKQKKNLANLLILGILVLALPLAVRTMREQQIIKLRATADPIVFKGDNVSQKDGKWVAKKPQISLELTSTLGPVGVGTSNPVSSPTPSPSPSPTPAVCSGNACTDCILNNRDDVLDYYKKNGWDTSCAGWGKIVTDWCKVDPASCQELKAGSCSAVCSITTFVLPPKKSVSFSLIKTAFAAETCSNGTKKVGEQWPECKGCDEGVVTCIGQDLYDFKSVKNPSANCGAQCVDTTCKYNNDPADKYNQCCGDGLSQQIIRKRDASGTACGYDKGDCNQKDSACGSGGGTDKCPAGQDPIGGGARDKIKNKPDDPASYLVDTTVVGSDLKPYTGNGECGYKYYVWKSTLSNGNFCVAYSFGKWTDQNDCKKVPPPAGSCGATRQSPDQGAGCIACITGSRTSLVNDIKSLNHSKFDTCTAQQLVNEWCNGGISSGAVTDCNTTKASAACASKCSGTSSCPVDGNLSISPNPAKVGDTVTFQYKAGEDVNLGEDTFSGGVTNCKIDSNLANRRYTCTAQSAVTDGIWSHKWNNGANCGSASYTINGGSATTVAFRVAENPTDLDKAEWRPYTSHPMTVEFEFQDKKPGQKSVFVDFKDSAGTVKREIGNITLLGGGPAVTSCSLSFEGNNTTLNLTGDNFGNEKGTIKSGDTALTQIKEWKANKIKVVWPNAPTGETLPVILTTKDGQTSPDSQCSSITQLSLGAKVFCRTASAQDTDNVDLTLVGDFSGGTKAKQKVKIDKEGNIAGLSQRLEDGKNYKLSLKAPKSVRKTVNFSASGGSNNIPDFVLPVGDIFPTLGGDGTINTLDKAELNRQWIISQSSAGRSGDFNGDGRVNSIDWACMRYDFGKSDDTEPSAPSASANTTTGVGTTAP